MSIRTEEHNGRWTGALLALPLVVFLLLMLLYPLGQLVIMAFADGPPRLDSVAWLALRNSTLLSIGVAALSVITCFVPAWALARWTFRGKTVLRTALTVPLTFSGIVVGFLAVSMLGRVGFIPTLMERLTGVPLASGAAYGFGGLLCGYLYFEIPRATLALESAFRSIDVDLEAAAATLGAGPVRRVFQVILPIAGPSILSVFLLAFAVSAGSFGVALMLSRRFTILPVEIYTSFTGFLDDGRAATLSLLLILMALVVSGISALLRRDR